MLHKTNNPEITHRLALVVVWPTLKKGLINQKMRAWWPITRKGFRLRTTKILGPILSGHGSILICDLYFPAGNG